MKKSILFSILALGMAAVSCDDFDFPNPPAQSNEQLPVIGTDMVLETPSAGQTVDLSAVNAADASVLVGRYVSSEDFPAEAYTLSYVLQLAGDKDFSNPFDVACTTTGNDIYASPDLIDAAFHGTLGTIDPSARELNGRFKVYAVDKEAGTRYRVGGEDAFFGQQQLTFVPFNPGFTVEEKYYLIGTCTGGAIDATKAIELSNSGASPYDDPNFSVVVDITADQASAGYNWAVVPASTLAAGTGVVMVPAAEFAGESASGYLEDADAPGLWNTIYESDKHLISVNVRPDENGRYKFSAILALDYLYVIGDGSHAWEGENPPSWQFDYCQALATNNYINYFGYAYLATEYKLSKARAWGFGDFGGGDGILTNGGGNIHNNDGEGLYWLTADISAMKYTQTAITTIGIIGDATPGGWDASTPLAPSENPLRWKLTVKLTDGTMKFRANDAWDINLGGSLLDLTQDGDNIPVQAGEYDLTLDLSAIPYTATLSPR